MESENKRNSFKGSTVFTEIKNLFLILGYEGGHLLATFQSTFHHLIVKFQKHSKLTETHSDIF